MKESRDRVYAAIKTTGFRFPPGQRITVNLAPADIKKEGSAFEVGCSMMEGNLARIQNPREISPLRTGGWEREE